jgi:hypothetical protein
MTEHKSFKRLVRARMEKTGESYTAARARLLAAAEEPGADKPPLVTSDDAIRERTGRGWEEWFDLLDEWGARDRPHKEVARWVAEQLAIEPALDRVADTLARRGATAADTLAEQYLRIAGRLVRLQGQQGTLTATVSTSASQTGYAMHAVALAVRLGDLGYVPVLVAWQGLDATSNTVDRALVAVGSALAGATGSSSVAPPSADRILRFADLSSGVASLASASAGTLTVTDAQFRGDCPGIANTASESCSTGRERVGVAATLALPGSAPGTLDVETTGLPAFLLETR